MYELIVIGERFGQLPGTVEREMDEYTINRVLEYFAGEVLARED